MHPTENRGLSLWEAAAFQTFPSSYRWAGSYGSIERQIGNAVPVWMAEELGASSFQASGGRYAHPQRLEHLGELFARSAIEASRPLPSPVASASPPLVSGRALPPDLSRCSSDASVGRSQHSSSDATRRRGRAGWSRGR